MSYDIDPWHELRRFTQARIALGRTGGSLPTGAVLELGLAHARARDAVHARLDCQDIIRQLGEIGYRGLAVRSAAGDRRAYLSRPELGRQLEPASRARLEAERLGMAQGMAQATAEGQGHGGAQPAGAVDVAFVIADGLSAIAAARHAVPVLRELHHRLPAAWRVAPVIVAELARVALGDDIGAILQAQQLVMLIGERPGLSAPDSLGLYLTYAPRPGRKDAERNCISNIRSGGLSYEAAAHKLLYLMSMARQLKLSGIALKDGSELPGARSGHDGQLFR